MNPKKQQLIIGAVLLLLIPALIIGGITLFREATKPKTSTPAPAPSLPRDPSVPAERAITFMRESYSAQYCGSDETSGVVYDTYFAKPYTFLINRQTDEIVRVHANKGDTDTPLAKDALRKLSREHAAKLTGEDLAAYTVTDRWWGTSSCSHGANTGFYHYVSTWVYGSENPEEVAQKSFALEITAETGRIVTFERPEYWAAHTSDLVPLEEDTFVQLSTAVPFPELPEVSQLEEMFFPTETE